MELKEQKTITAEEMLEMMFNGTSGETIIYTTPKELKRLAEKAKLIYDKDKTAFE